MPFTNQEAPERSNWEGGLANVSSVFLVMLHSTYTRTLRKKCLIECGVCFYGSEECSGWEEHIESFQWLNHGLSTHEMNKEKVNLRCLIELITTMGNRGSVLLGTSEEPCIMRPPIFHPGNIKRQHLFIGSGPKWSRYAPGVVNAFALPDLCLCQNDWKGSHRYLLGWQEGNPRKAQDLWGWSLQFTSEYNWVPQ